MNEQVKDELMIKEYVPTKDNVDNNSCLDNKTIPTEEDTRMIEEGFDENVKPFACPKCTQAFSRPHNLKSHLTTHSEERPFRCEVCNHHFRRQHDLKRHQKLHTGERPYQCKNCTRSFARLDALNRHCKAEGGSACTLVKHHQAKQDQNMVRIHDMPYPTDIKKRRSEYDNDAHKTATMTITPPSDISPPSTANSSPTSSRPIIPQLQIPHPASHLYPKNVHHYPIPHNHQLLPSPNLILPKNLTPPVYTSQKALPITPSSPPPQPSNPKSPLYPASPWTSSPYSPRPTLPPLPANHDVERLFKENEGLKKDINQLRAMAQKEASGLKSQIHDLQVENKVLRSLINTTSE